MANPLYGPPEATEDDYPDDLDTYLRAPSGAVAEHVKDYSDEALAEYVERQERRVMLATEALTLSRSALQDLLDVQVWRKQAARSLVEDNHG